MRKEFSKMAKVVKNQGIVYSTNHQKRGERQGNIDALITDFGFHEYRTKEREMNSREDQILHCSPSPCNFPLIFALLIFFPLRILLCVFSISFLSIHIFLVA